MFVKAIDPKASNSVLIRIDEAQVKRLLPSLHRLRQFPQALQRGLPAQLDSGASCAAGGEHLVTQRFGLPRRAQGLCEK